MEKLPLEVLHRVFTQLPWTQRKSCTLVCRFWATIMKASDLQCNNSFYIKNERNEESMLSKFLSDMNQKPDLAFQVEYLTLASIPDEYDTRPLADLFPNLKKLLLIPVSAGRLKRPSYFDSLDRPALDLQSKSFAGITYVEDFYHCEFTRFLVLNGLCSCLETLVLNVQVAGENPSDIFPLLKDMPVLKKLTVYHTPIAIDVIETIHTNIPSLEKLCLSDVEFLQNELPQDILPALKLTCLNISSYDSNDEGKINWLRYIPNKYPNLKHFNYDIATLSHGPELREIYSAEYPRILQRIGPQLESLTLAVGMDTGYRAVRTLGDLDCRIRKLDICLMDDNGGFGALAETSSFKYIQNLTLSNININIDVSQLKEMSSLKTLAINFLDLDPDYVYQEHEIEERQAFIEDVTVDMNQLFRQFPTHLETASIGLLYAKFDNERKGEVFNIKELTLHNIKTNGGRIDQFISNHFPNLHSLSLEDSFEKDEVIMLPKYHLSHLALSKWFVKVNVRVATNDGILVFSDQKQSTKARPNLKSKLLPVSENDIQDLPCVTIICSSVEKLFVGGIQACLKREKDNS